MRTDYLLILIFIYILSMIVGYILGRIHTNIGVYNIEEKPKSFFNTKNDSSVTQKVSIDDTKFVIDIKTSGLEKKYDSLGETKSSEENISNSINKLKNMKR